MAPLARWLPHTFRPPLRLPGLECLSSRTFATLTLRRPAGRPPCQRRLTPRAHPAAVSLPEPAANPWPLPLDHGQLLPDGAGEQVRPGPLASSPTGPRAPGSRRCPQTGFALFLRSLHHSSSRSLPCSLTRFPTPFPRVPRSSSHSLAELPSRLITRFLGTSCTSSRRVPAQSTRLAAQPRAQLLPGPRLPHTVPAPFTHSPSVFTRLLTVPRVPPSPHSYPFTSPNTVHTCP